MTALTIAEDRSAWPPALGLGLEGIAERGQGRRVGLFEWVTWAAVETDWCIRFAVARADPAERDALERAVEVVLGFDFNGRPFRGRRGGGSRGTPRRKGPDIGFRDPSARSRSCDPG